MGGAAALMGAGAAMAGKTHSQLNQYRVTDIVYPKPDFLASFGRNNAFVSIRSICRAHYGCLRNCGLRSNLGPTLWKKHSY
jgi:hypothetical protein